MVKLIKGDLLTSNEDVIAHGVNIRGGFGSGVAGQIAKIYPNVKKAYLDKFQEDGWKLGDIQVIDVGRDIIVINCATQHNYGYDGRRLYADYEAIEQCLIKVKEFCIRNNMTLGIPRIGCGLAGGDWQVVEDILLKVFNNYDVTVYIL